MTTFSGIQSNIPVKQKDLVDDINFNAAPSHIVNDTAMTAFKANPSGGTIDFPSAKARAIFQLRSRNPINLRNYIPNLPSPPSPPPPSTDETQQDRQACSGSADPSHSTNSSNDVEEKASAAAEALMEEAEDLSETLASGDWVVEDQKTGYEYVDPAFYETYEKLVAVLNALQIIGMVLDCLDDLKQAVIVAFSGKGGGSSSSYSASEACGAASQSAMMQSQGQLMEMTEQVWSHNNEIIDQQINQAKEDAKAGVGSWISYVVSFFTNDAVERDKQEQISQATYETMQEYESFMKMVQQKYETVLGDASLYANAGAELAQIFASLSWDNMVENIGGDKVDVNRNKILALQMYLNSQENVRRIQFMIRAAIMELKKMVVEGKTGFKSSTNITATLKGVIDSLESFENMVFSAMASQLQSTISAQNRTVDAYNSWKMQQAMLVSSWAFGSMPLIGGLSQNIGDFFAMEYWNLTTDDVTTPTQLSENEVFRILADLYGTSVDNVRDSYSSDNEYLQQLNDYEQEEWEVLEQLSEENLVYTGDDGYQGMYESEVDALRERLDAIQNKERLLVMYVETLTRLKKIAVKIGTGMGDAAAGDDATGALKAGMDSRILAFDLKFAGIKNKMDNYNVQVKERKMLWEAAGVAIGSAVGIGVCIILMAASIIASPFTGGASLVVGIGAIAAFGQLGASLGQIIYNVANPVDNKVYDQSDFYASEGLKDSIEKQYDEQIDRLGENSHVDSADRKDPMAPDTQWVKDTELFMDVRNELTTIYIREQIAMMYIKAINDMKTMVVSNFAGTSVSGDFSMAQDASRARLQTKIKGYDLKGQMVEDIISTHNMAVSQTAENNWAFVSAAISILSIVTGGLSTSAGEALQEGWQVYEVTSTAIDLVGSATTCTKNLLDATSGYGELDEYQNMIDQINLLTENSFNVLGIEGQQILRGALSSMNENTMITSIGSGKVAVDSSQYYASMRAIQALFNRIIIALRIAEAIAKVRARITGGSSPLSTSDGFEAEKANFLKQLDLAYERVQTYAERSNAMAEAWRQLTVAVVMVAVKVVLKLSDHYKWIDKFKEKLDTKLGATEHQIEIKIPKGDDVFSKAGRLAMKALTSETAWDGTISTGDLSALVIDMITNSEIIASITRGVYDKATKGDHQAKKVDQLSVSSADSQVERMEIENYNNQLGTAALGVSSAVLGVEMQKTAELNQLFASSVENSINSVLDDSRMSDKIHFVPDVAEQPLAGQEAKTPIPLSMTALAQFQRKAQMILAKVDLSDPQSVAAALVDLDTLSDTVAKANGLTEDQSARFELGVASMVADELAKNAKKELAQQTMLAVFDQAMQHSSDQRSQILLSYSETILAAMAKKQSEPERTALNREIDNRIYSIWQKVAIGEMTTETANAICATMELTRPETVAAGRLAAKLLAIDPSVALAEGEASLPADRENQALARQYLFNIYAQAKAIDLLAAQGSDYSAQLEVLKKELQKIFALDASYTGFEMGSEESNGVISAVQNAGEEELAGLLVRVKESPAFKNATANFPAYSQALAESIAILSDVESKKAVVEEAHCLVAQTHGNLERLATVLQKKYVGNKKDRIERELEKEGYDIDGVPEPVETGPVAGVSVFGDLNQDGYAGEDASDQDQDESDNNLSQAESDVWSGGEKAQKELIDRYQSRNAAV